MSDQEYAEFEKLKPGEEVEKEIAFLYNPEDNSKIIISITDMWWDNNAEFHEKVIYTKKDST